MGGTFTEEPGRPSGGTPVRAPSSAGQPLSDALLWCLPALMVALWFLLGELRGTSPKFSLERTYTLFKTLTVAALIASSPHLLLTRTLADFNFRFSARVPFAHLKKPIILLGGILAVTFVLGVCFIPSTRPTFGIALFVASTGLYWTLIPLLSQTQARAWFSRRAGLVGVGTMMILTQALGGLGVYICASLSQALVTAMLIQKGAARDAGPKAQESASWRGFLNRQLAFIGPAMVAALWLPRWQRWLTRPEDHSFLLLDFHTWIAFAMAVPILFHAIVNLEASLGAALLRFRRILAGAKTTSLEMQTLEHRLKRSLASSYKNLGLVLLASEFVFLGCAAAVGSLSQGDILSFACIALEVSAYVFTLYLVTVCFFLGDERLAFVIASIWLATGAALAYSVSELPAGQLSPLTNALGPLAASALCLTFALKHQSALFYWAFLPRNESL